MRKITFKKKQYKRNFTLLFLTLILTALGLVFLADASSPLALSRFSDKYFFVRQQIISAGLGLILLLVFSKIDYKVWQKYALYLFAGGVFMLLVVLIPGISTQTLGARRWIHIGSATFQPSEYIKLLLCIYFAKLASENKKLISYVAALGLIGILVIIEPDMGTLLTIIFIGFSQIYVAGLNVLKMFGVGLLGIITGVILILSSSYRRARLLTYFSLAQDPLGRDYHIRQVLIAVGSGGLFGVGFGASKQKFLFLPEAATDSIFAIIAEEVGFVGSLVILFLFLLLTFRCLKIARDAPDKFSQVLAVGITAWISGQTLLNIGAMLSIVPLTGLPLPFFSSGGSALTAILAGIGILLNIQKHEY